jgi:diguanylate cyclase (GGDEF)-like protein/PAS domain S-box-containing protein
VSILNNENKENIEKKEREQEQEKELFAKALKNISDSVLITDKNFKIEYINKAAEKLFGYSLNEIKGKTPKIFNAELTSAKIQREMYQIISKGEIYQNELLNKRKDGSTFICEMKINPLTNKNGEIYAYIGIQRDITEKKKQQEELKNQLKFQKALATISTDLLDINAANIGSKINSALKTIGHFFEIDRSYIFQFFDNKNKMSNTYEWCAQNINSEKENLQNLSTARFSWWMSKLAQNDCINISDVTKMDQKAAAEQKILHQQNIKSIIVMPLFIDNNLFGFFGFDFVENKKVFSDEDIRVLKIFTDYIINAFSKHIDHVKIKRLTQHDSLTGLYNRQFFEEKMLSVDIKRQLPISIIVADINGLKVINDSYGHNKGDFLIKKTAEIINNQIRKTDILARYGGGEFAVLLPHTDQKAAEKIVNRIKNRTKKYSNNQLTISVSFGTATKNSVDQDINKILKLADDKMYQNKLSESKSVKNKIVKSLISTLEVKSNETKEHTLRMTKLSVSFGDYLGLSNSELNRLSLLSTLHDIGKITIDNKILKKADKLTESEWKMIKKHPKAGYNIAKSSEEFELVAEEIYSHHEKWDGSGYPRGLKEKEIPFLARIISLVDAYDVMTSDRPYKKSISRKKALAEIENCAGSQFDPNLAAKFISFVKKEVK